MDARRLNARKYLLENGGRDRDVIGETRTPLPFTTAATFQRPTQFELEPDVDSTADAVEQNKNKDETV